MDDLPIALNVRDVEWVRKMQKDCYGEKIVLELDGQPSTTIHALECSITLTAAA